MPQSQLTVVNFNQKDTNLLGAGQYNGQFAFFDVRKGSQPVESTAIEHSHRCCCLLDSTRAQASASCGRQLLLSRCSQLARRQLVSSAAQICLVLNTAHHHQMLAMPTAFLNHV